MLAEGVLPPDSSALWF